MTTALAIDQTPDCRSPAIWLAPLLATLSLAVLTTFGAADLPDMAATTAARSGSVERPDTAHRPVERILNAPHLARADVPRWPTPPAPLSPTTDVDAALLKQSDATHPWHFRTRLGPFASLGEFDALPLADRAQPRGIAMSPPSIDPASVPVIAQSEKSRSADDFIVMIDPGHGGSDPGSVGPNGLHEAALTRDIAERTRLFLSEIDDVTVLLTRDGDEGLSRKRRVERIRDGGADLVLSLHFNHLPQTDVTLVESFYAGDENIAESLAVRRARGTLEIAAMPSLDTRITEGSARLAQFVQRRVFGEVNHANPTATDAGVKRDTLYVLTRSFVPGALIELTCLSNPGEAERLATEAYRMRLAAALADAVRDYRRSVADRPLGELDA